MNLFFFKPVKSVKLSVSRARDEDVMSLFLRIEAIKLNNLTE